MNITRNMEQFFIQELDSIGLKLAGKEEIDDKVAFTFNHRGIDVTLNVFTRDEIITKICDLIIDGEKCGLEYGASKNTGENLESQFTNSIDRYVALLNKEIMKLDGIGVQNV